MAAKKKVAKKKAHKSMSAHPDDLVKARGCIEILRDQLDAMKTDVNRGDPETIKRLCNGLTFGMPAKHR